MRLIRPVVFVFLTLGTLGQAGCGGVAGPGSTQGNQSSGAQRSPGMQATSVSPNSVTAGQAGFALTVKGANFPQASVVLLNNSPRTTAFVSTDEVTAQVTSADVAAASTISVIVMNSATRAQSNTLSLTVTGKIQITTSALPEGVVGASYTAPLTESGGAAPFHWSIANGSLPPGITMDSSNGTLTGMATASGNFTFTAWVTDALNSSAKASLTLAVNTATPVSQTYLPAGYYGAGLGSDGLANTTLGPGGNTVSYRLRARHSGVLQQVRLYLIPDHTGYAAGTGGTIQVTLHTDDGSSAHGPSATVLATYVMSNMLSLPSPDRYFYVVKFASPPTLTSGNLYHLVFRNIDASPSANYLSVDDLYQVVPTTPVQPTMNDIDAAVLLGDGGSSWSPRAGYTPIYELDFSNGATEGIGYIEGWVGAPQFISGTNAVRETFTVAGSPVTAASVAVRVARVNGADPLQLRLENAGGSLVEEITVPATQIQASNSSNPNYGWMRGAFSSAHTLVPGQTYHLDLGAPSSSEYMAFPLRKGVNYGFNSDTYFPDGHAEFTQSGAWVGWTQWGVTNRTDGDLQFYFAP